MVQYLCRLLTYLYVDANTAEICCDIGSFGVEGEEEDQPQPKFHAVRILTSRKTSPTPTSLHFSSFTSLHTPPYHMPQDTRQSQT